MFAEDGFFLHARKLTWGVVQTFTIGRGNEIVCAAIDALAPLIDGLELSQVTKDWGATWRYLTSDSQLRWIGPDKGVIHMATGALVNALWDLWAKTLQKPLWRLVADMSPEELVRCIDFRYMDDVLTEEEAVDMLRQSQANKEERIEDALRNRAVPAYTTSAGWLGYSEEKMSSAIRENFEAGFRHFKFKVGTDLETDRRRLTVARKVLGYGDNVVLMLDANQVSILLSVYRKSPVADSVRGLVSAAGHRLREGPFRFQALVHRRAHVSR